MRVFVAAFPPPEVREALALSGGFVEKSGVRRVPPSNIHLTLKFLGDVPEKRLEGINAALRDVAGRHGPFRVEFRRLGAFPSLERARVIWASVGEGDAGLSSLAADVEDSLFSLGFGREKRLYKPHATLGRVGKDFVRLPEEVEVEVPAFVLRRLDLIQGKLGAGGAVYPVLQGHPLRAA